MIIDTTIRRIMKPGQPEWLTALQNDMALITNEAAVRYWPGAEPLAVTGSYHPGDKPGARPYYNYRLEHVQQVERDAARLMLEVAGVDEEIISAAVWIHDRFQPQFEGEQHAYLAAQWARENLAALGFPGEKVETVSFAVARCADRAGAIPENAVEARLLWDADHLARMGTLAIVAELLAAPAFREQRINFTGQSLLWLEILERTHRSLDSFYFPTSRRLALQRYDQQRAFCEAFAWDVEA